MRVPIGIEGKFASLVAVLIVVLFTGTALASTTGQITGTVTDRQTGEPLPGVTVLIKGTSIGAATDFDGFYRIQNVAPGTYELAISLVGYAPTTVSDVKVSIDKVTTVDVKLISEAVQFEEVKVVAKRPPIESRVTSNEDAIGADEIGVIPVKDTKGILATQVGFVKRGTQLHARGGRAGEVVFRVDGVDTNDPLGVNSPRTADIRTGVGNDASGREFAKAESPFLSMDVSSNDISEISIIKAGWPAEYGNLQSGLVNLATKEGDARFTSGYLEYTTDDFGSPSLNKYSFNSDRFDASISGPVPLVQDVLFPKLGLEFPGESFAYYASFSVDKTDTYTAYSDFAPSQLDTYWGREERLWDVFRVDFPMRQSNSYKTSIKLTYKLDAARKVNLSYKKDWSEYIDWDWDWRYTPHTAPRQETWSELWQVYFTDKPGWIKNTFYEFQVSKYTIAATRKPGGNVPGDFLFFDEWEFYEDENNNGQWDDDEPYIDSNGNGQYDFGEPFTDLNGNGTWDSAEEITQDTNGNGEFDYERRRVQLPDDPEPWQDGDINLGEPFLDMNQNGVYDGNDVDIWTSADDLNGNGKYDGPNDDWTPGIPYRDLNKNGEYDAPDGFYQYGEPFVDENGNGKWDGTDLFFDYGGYDGRATYSHRRSDIYTIKLDVTSAPSEHHDLKTGVEYKFIKLRMADLRYPFSRYIGQSPDPNEPWNDRGSFRDFYWRTPKQGAFYIQDNISYGELYINLGFRWDYFYQAQEVFSISDEEAPYYAIEDIKDTQNKFSPRLGVSYPISEKAKVYFNYGHAYQLPEYYRFYARATQNITAGGGGARGIVGNVNLDFEKTVQYELGVEYLIDNAHKLKISGFYKDQYGLINVVEGQGVLAADRYTNLDYARSRGFELELTKSIADYLTWGAKYEYSWAFGKSSSGTSDYYLRFTTGQIPLKESALDWDIRHQVNIDATLSIRKDDHPVVAGIKLPDAWGASIIWQFNSGYPYSPSSQHPGIVVIGNVTPPQNTERQKPYSNVDLRLYKDFAVSGLDFTYSLWITNLFNKKNQFRVYGDTGRADTSQLTSDRRIVTGIDHDKDPANWGPGRNIKMALAVKF
ncbi:MAG: TonB-dependent receptor [candidate division Zixibacteria bacterium]|nr:TonB-dependent receptor [candidate division Zixibacteria bacterium]